MTDSKFNDMWQLLKDNSITLNQSLMKINLTCMLCKNVMIDACQTACNCQFCFKCISDYLKDGNKFCPGDRKDCHDHYLVLERDVLRNIRINNKVSKLTAKCPRETCDCIVELIDMRKHMDLCTVQCDQLNDSNTTPCSEGTRTTGYTNTPCDEIDMNKSVFQDWMSKMNTAFNSLTQKCEISFNQINCLIVDSQIKKDQIQTLIKHINVQENEIILLNQESRKKDISIETLKQQINELMIERRPTADLITDVRSGDCVLNLKLEKMDEAVLHKEISNLNQMIITMEENLKIVSQKIERKLNNVVKWNKLSPIADVDLMWRINKYSKKIGSLKGMYSEAFYSKGYKMCMRTYFDSESVYIWCVLMSGDNDSSVTWPLKHHVTVSVINQETMATYISWTSTYDSYQKDKRAFDRPKGERNSLYIGTDSLLRYVDIKSIPALTTDDSILLACIITDPLEV